MTRRNISIDIDDSAYQRAISRALGEQRTINQILAELLRDYAGPVPEPVPLPAPLPVPIESLQPSIPSFSPSLTDEISTPSAQPQPMADTAPSAVDGQTIYTVQSGDNIKTIAKQFYGNSRLYPRIQRANGLKDPRVLFVGQELIIPSIGGNSPTPSNGGSVIPTPAPQPTPQPPIVVPTPALQPTPQPQPTLQPQPTPQPQPVPQPPTRPSNPKPPARFVGSPHVNQRPAGNQGVISAVIVHATANDRLQSVIEWFNNPIARVSAHYTIGKDGTIVQHVKDSVRAWHAGVSSWQGRDDLNSWSIGIELVNKNDGQDPYPEAQHQANVNLIAYLSDRYKIDPRFIRTHYDVSPRRKTDPKGYNMDRLRSEVANRL